MNRNFVGDDHKTGLPEEPPLTEKGVVVNDTHKDDPTKKEEENAAGDNYNVVDAIETGVKWRGTKLRRIFWNI